LIDLPESTYGVQFLYLWGDRLYTEADGNLYVYSVIDLTSPSATYRLDDLCCYSALITDNRLYLGGVGELHIFEVTPSLNEPLKPVTKIPAKSGVLKILRVGDDLLLG
jgi:hypothetical protein